MHLASVANREAMMPRQPGWSQGDAIGKGYSTRIKSSFCLVTSGSYLLQSYLLQSIFCHGRVCGGLTVRRAPTERRRLGAGCSGRRRAALPSARWTR